MSFGPKDMKHVYCNKEKICFMKDFKLSLRFISLWCEFCLNPSLVVVLTVPVEPTPGTADPCEEPVKKKQAGRRREAASQRLLAVGHKIKHVFISG